jgi:TRAP-type C4-dicarboxylate transport system permease large subunit
VKSWFHWGLTFPLFLALSAALIYGNAEKVHSQLLRLGEEMFGGYFQIQSDPTPPPNCDTLFSDQGQAKQSEGAQSDEDDLDDLLGEEEVDEEAEAKAKAKAKADCDQAQIQYTEIKARITPSVKVYRAIESAVGLFVSVVVDHFKHILVLILLLGAFSASVKGEHIALRPAQSRGAYQLRELSQMLAFGAVFASMLFYRALLTSPEELTLNMVWLIGLASLCVAHLYRLYTPPPDLSNEWDHGATLSIPLFAVMALISGSYFFSVGHTSGLAIEMTKLTEHAILYVHVALYVWVGMLLKQSPLASQVFDILRPWKFSPALLAGVVVIGAAVPTAYSGASGIFVIAAGAMIYEELRKAGARRQLALAATAMSGSLGVVLNPCLLIVIIASLNKQVTTDELYGWGVKVFFLTSGLFLIICLMQRDRSLPWIGAARDEAWTGSKQAIKAISPNILWGVGIILFYAFVLRTHLDEHSAPMILPVLLMALLWLNLRSGDQTPSDSDDPASAPESESEPSPSLSQTLLAATEEGGPHIGALLSLMGLSICVGGVIERAELMSMFPATFGSLWLTMLALVLILVLIGMSMDPYGAVILVSATIADIAYQNGVNPVHFWVVVMVAFELGYLSPPVALNHLLTRQVVGEDEVEAALAEGVGFMGRHERLILPMIVMGISLILVAFIPLFFY